MFFTIKKDATNTQYFLRDLAFCTFGLDVSHFWLEKSYFWTNLSYFEPNLSYLHRVYPTLSLICPTLHWSFVLPYFRWKRPSDPCTCQNCERLSEAGLQLWEAKWGRVALARTVRAQKRPSYTFLNCEAKWGRNTLGLTVRAQEKQSYTCCNCERLRELLKKKNAD